jgi:hypothetical protein
MIVPFEIKPPTASFALSKTPQLCWGYVAQLISQELLVGGPVNTQYLGISWSPPPFIIISLSSLGSFVAMVMMYTYSFRSDMPPLLGSLVVLDAC